MNAVARMDMPMLRVPPNAVDAEQSVLGGLMLAPDRVEDVADRLAESDFYRKDHRLIFRAIMELSARGQPCDTVTLGDWFERADLDGLMGGSSYLVELSNNTPSAANITAYADIVRERSVRRQVIGLATNIVEQAYGGDANGAQLLDTSIAELMAMQKVETRYEFTLRQAIGLAINAAHAAGELPDGEIPGIHTGLKKLDEVLGGWHNSDLTIIGARPAMGKTALLLNLALAANVPCGLVSAEQPAQQIGSRVMSIESHVPAMRMRNGRFDESDLPRLDAAARRLIERQCMIYDRSAPTIADVSRIARKWKQQNGIRILFVDYVQRIEASQTDRRTPKHERVGEVVRGLKDLARDLDIPVVSLAQVGRQVEARTDKRPGMGDLSDSSEIEKEADQILTLYRDEVYDENSEHKGIAEIDVCKNRHGPNGVVRCAWLAETMRFANLDYGHDH
jgi:replicative DNA helicase